MIENEEVKVEIPFVKGKCEDCKWSVALSANNAEELCDKVGVEKMWGDVIVFCTLGDNKRKITEILNKSWSNMKELNGVGIISSPTYKDVVSGIRNDIEFVQERGVPIKDFDFGRECFEAKGDCSC
jgi:formylmethanofuran dehydrogenase subunit D